MQKTSWDGPEPLRNFHDNFNGHSKCSYNPPKHLTKHNKEVKPFLNLLFGKFKTHRGCFLWDKFFLRILFYRGCQITSPPRGLTCPRKFLMKGVSYTGGRVQENSQKPRGGGGNLTPTVNWSNLYKITVRQHTYFSITGRNFRNLL